MQPLRERAMKAGMAAGARVRLERNKHMVFKKALQIMLY